MGLCMQSLIVFTLLTCSSNVWISTVQTKDIELMFYHACLNNYDNKDLLAIRGTNDLVTTVTAAGPAEVNEPSVEATLIPNISSNPVSTTDENTEVNSTTTVAQKTTTDAMSMKKRDIRLSDTKPEESRLEQLIGTRPVKIAIGDKYIMSLLNDSYQISRDFSCRLTFQLNAALTSTTTSTQYTRHYLKYTMSDWNFNTCDVEIGILKNGVENYYFSCENNINLKQKYRRQTLSSRTYSAMDTFSVQYNVTFGSKVITRSSHSAEITIEALSETLPVYTTTRRPERKPPTWIAGVVLGFFGLVIGLACIAHCCNAMNTVTNPASAMRGMGGGGLGGNNAMLGMGVGALAGGALMNSMNKNGTNGMGGMGNMVTGNTGVQHYPPPPHGYAQPYGPGYHPPQAGYGAPGYGYPGFGSPPPYQASPPAHSSASYYPPPQQPHTTASLHPVSPAQSAHPNLNQPQGLVLTNNNPTAAVSTLEQNPLHATSVPSDTHSHRAQSPQGAPGGGTHGNGQQNHVLPDNAVELEKQQQPASAQNSENFKSQQ